MTAANQPVPRPEPQPLDREQISTYSMLSLIFGILWLAGAGSIAAVVLGHKAINSMNQTGDQANRGVAVARVVLGWIGVGASPSSRASCSALFILIALIVAAV